MLNRAMVIGHLGADPEMRYSANGNAITTFSVATSRTFNDAAGERKEETEWFRVVTWNRLAEICAEYLRKGRQVYVEGRMQTRSWEDQQGQKRYATELVAQEVKFLGGRDDDGYQPGGGTSKWEDGPPDIEQDDLPF